MEDVRTGKVKPKTGVRLAGLVLPTVTLSRNPAKAAEQVMTYGRDFAIELAAKLFATLAPEATGDQQ